MPVSLGYRNNAGSHGHPACLHGGIFHTPVGEGRYRHDLQECIAEHGERWRTQQRKRRELKEELESRGLTGVVITATENARQGERLTLRVEGDYTGTG